MRVSIGTIKNLEEAERAIRDLEQQINALFPDDAPNSGVVALVRNSDGGVEQWTIVSAGGCTVTQDPVLKQFKISVP